MRQIVQSYIQVILRHEDFFSREKKTFKFVILNLSVLTDTIMDLS